MQSFVFLELKKERIDDHARFFLLVDCSLADFWEFRRHCSVVSARISVSAFQRVVFCVRQRVCDERRIGEVEMFVVETLPLLGSAGKRCMTLAPVSGSVAAAASEVHR